MRVKAGQKALILLFFGCTSPLSRAPDDCGTLQRYAEEVAMGVGVAARKDPSRAPPTEFLVVAAWLPEAPLLERIPVEARVRDGEVCVRWPATGRTVCLKDGQRQPCVP